MQSFKDKLLFEVLTNKKNDLTDNYDELQCGKLITKKKNILERLLDSRIPLNANFNFKRNFFHYLKPKTFYRNLIDTLPDASPLHDLLQDEESRNLLVKIYAYRILGHKKIKLPRNTPKYWADNDKAATLDTGHDNIKIDFMNLDLPLLDLLPIGYNIKLNTHPIAIACIYTQKQYEYHNKTIKFKPEPGDIVLDGGACWGDSTLYFAHEAGDKGKVFSFEFVPKNLSILKSNIERNPHLSGNIEIIEHPMWDKSGEELYCADHGPGSSVNNQKPTDQINPMIFKTLSIDDLVAKNQLHSVDFIKMDIEGSEMNALIGAEKTLKKFRPKLAISVYHKPDDFVTIPSYLNGLNLGYEFYLDHHTIHVWETVLYAVPSNR